MTTAGPGGFNRRIHSPTWNYFKRLSPGLARCDLCKKKLSFKTTISNLKRHLLLQHNVNLGLKVAKSYAKTEEKLNLRDLISLVKEHPCLWDIHSVSFNDPEKKYEVWRSIAATLCPGLDPVLGVAKVSERFHALREHFFTYRLNNGSDKQIEASAYYHDLDFLDSSQEIIDISSPSYVEEKNDDHHTDIFEINEIDIKNEPLDESYIGDDVQYTTMGATKQEVLSGTQGKGNEEQTLEWLYENKYKETKSIESKDVEEKQERSPCVLQLNNADKDVLFLLSLTEELKRVPKAKKTVFKGEFMMTVSRLVQKYRQTSSDSFVGGQC